MSKYIDKDKVLEYIIFEVVGKDITCGELKRGIESLPAIEVGEETDDWIPLDNDSAAPGYKVICQDRYENMMLGYAWVDEYGIWICEDDNIMMDDVVAWRPLPKPYKGGDTE